MRRPLLSLAGLFAAGCLLIDGESGPGEPLVLVLLAAFLLGLAFAAGEGRRSWAALAAAALALGVAAAEVEGLQFEAGSLRRRFLLDAPEGRALRVVGTVSGDAVETAGHLVLVLDVEGVEAEGRLEPARGRARIEVDGSRSKPRLLDGERVAAWATLRALPWARSASEGLAASGVCKSVLLLERREGSGAAWPRRAAAVVREAARRVLMRSILPGTERGLVLAMVLGDRSEIDDPTAESFRASGTYHVLALSGAQVALVAGLIVAALRRMRASPWAQALVTATATFGYALLVGGDVPVVRAALMASAILAGRALELDSDASNLLGLAGLLLLGHRPAAAADVGFQLSFGATLGILALADPLSRGVPRLPFRAEVAIAASVAVQGVLAPVLAAWFHRLAPAAVLLNLAAVPLSSGVLLAGFAVLVMAPFGSGPARIAGDVAWIAARALRVSGDLGPLGPWLDLRVAGPSLAALALSAGGLGLLYRQRRPAGLALLAASQLALAFGPLSPLADGRVHLTVIDVGQGDSLLLRSPAGRALLVDAGGSRDPRFDPGERKVAPELWRLGVHRVDALLVTHAHPDHVGGAPFVMKAFRVEELWEGPAPLHDPAWRQVEARLATARTTRRAVAEGMSMDWDGIRLEVIGPRRPRRPPFRVRNEDSVVLEVRFGETCLLLTGDVTGEAERALAVSRSAVVKVPHHGSRWSSGEALVARTAPRLAVVSVGAHNPFGHPHPEALERYRRAGALVLRTDRDGTVDVATDGRHLWVRTAREGQERRLP